MQILFLCLFRNSTRSCLPEGHPMISSTTQHFQIFPSFQKSSNICHLSAISPSDKSPCWFPEFVSSSQLSGVENRRYGIYAAGYISGTDSVSLLKAPTETNSRDVCGIKKQLVKCHTYTLCTFSWTKFISLRLLPHY